MHTYAATCCLCCLYHDTQTACREEESSGDDPAKEYKSFYLVDSNYVRTLAATASRKKGDRQWTCLPEASLTDAIPLWCCVLECYVDAWLRSLGQLAASKGIRCCTFPPTRPVPHAARDTSLLEHCSVCVLLVTCVLLLA